MRLERLLPAVLLTTIVAVAMADLEPSHLNVVESGRGKKGEKMVQEMIQAMMLVKNMVSFGLMFVSPIIQIKGFGLSVINTLINIGRFLVQMQSTQEMKQIHLAHLKVHSVSHPHQIHDSDDLWSSGSDSRYAYYAPPPRPVDRQDSGVADNFPPAQTSYPRREQQHVYPQYSPNLTKQMHR